MVVRGVGVNRTADGDVAVHQTMAAEAVVDRMAVREMPARGVTVRRLIAPIL